jgi:FAD-dependent urate hydroxylase
MLDLVIIGAGPYGISLAAHAQAHGLSYELLGYPMDFWKNQMPQNMFIRTPHDFVNFSDPEDRYTMRRYEQETGTHVETPLPRSVFLAYANWFAQKTGVKFTPELVESLVQADGCFTVVTETGRTLQSKHVVVATGVQHFKYMPDIYQSLPPELVTHTSGYTDYSSFKGQKVAVIGSGQSAWEAAGLLHLEGAEPELIYRREEPNYGGSRSAERVLRMLGNVFYRLPLAMKRKHLGQSPGSVAHFLRPYVEGKVPETGGASIEQLAVTSEGQVRMSLSNGEERVFDHVLSASGFHINLDRLPFLPKEMLGQIEREEGFEPFPKLDEHFQSSIHGLYFAGPLSSHSHGPTFRFILGLKKAAKTIIASLAKKEKCCSAA